MPAFSGVAIKQIDAMIDAKSLSAGGRTGTGLGLNPTGLIVGAKTEQIRKFRHDALPTYGVGKDKSKKYLFPL